jgi:hypothetical protein
VIFGLIIAGICLSDNKIERFHNIGLTGIILPDENDGMVERESELEWPANRPIVGDAKSLKPSHQMHLL